MPGPRYPGRRPLPGRGPGHGWQSGGV